MALWTFSTPARDKWSFDNQPWSLFSRVSILRARHLIQKADSTWQELPVLPVPNEMTAAQSAVFLGAQGFFDTSNLAASLDVMKRWYRGGVQYIIDDTLKAELVAAVTTDEPGGYSAYIAAAPGGAVMTGDEIMAGRGGRYG